MNITEKIDKYLNETKLSKAQSNILNIIKTLPASYRHNKTPAKKGGWVKWEFLEVYDRRTLDSIIKKGLIETSEYGVRVT